MRESSSRWNASRASEAKFHVNRAGHLLRAAENELDRLRTTVKALTSDKDRLRREKRDTTALLNQLIGMKGEACASCATAARQVALGAPPEARTAPAVAPAAATARAPVARLKLPEAPQPLASERRREFREFRSEHAARSAQSDRAERRAHAGAVADVHRSDAPSAGASGETKTALAADGEPTQASEEIAYLPTQENEAPPTRERRAHHSESFRGVDRANLPVGGATRRAPAKVDGFFSPAPSEPPVAPPHASPPPSPAVPPTIPEGDGTPTTGAADADPTVAAHASAIGKTAGGSDHESDDLDDDDDESQPLLTARKRRGSSRRPAGDSGAAAPLHLDAWRLLMRLPRAREQI